MRRHFRYGLYVARHKWFVFRAGLKTGAPIWRLIIHDWTKFLPVEWKGYVDNFYPKPLRNGEHVWVSIENSGFLGEVIDFRDDGPRRPTIRVRPLGAGSPVWCWANEVERKDQQGIAERFEAAWNHHQKANKHHWQYWVMFFDNPPEGSMTRYSILPMPDKYVREMVADWMGAGRAITGKWGVATWYSRNRANIVLHSRTRAYVEKLIEEVTGAPIPHGPPISRGYREGGPAPNKGTVQIGGDE